MGQRKVSCLTSKKCLLKGRMRREVGKETKKRRCIIDVFSMTSHMTHFAVPKNRNRSDGNLKFKKLTICLFKKAKRILEAVYSTYIKMTSYNTNDQ